MSLQLPNIKENSAIDLQKNVFQIYLKKRCFFKFYES